MRIAILELYYGQSGKTGYYNSQEIGLAKAYERMGHKVYIVLPGRGTDIPNTVPVTENITITRMPAKVIGVHSFYKLSCLKKWKIDLVHIDSDNQMYAAHVMKYCQKHRIVFYNYVGTINSDTDNLIKKRILDMMSRATIKMYRKTPTFVKTFGVQQALAQRGIKNVIVEPVGLDFDIIPIIKESKAGLRDKLRLPATKTLLLFVGRLEEYKKPMEAVRLLSVLDKKYVLIIIGDGNLRKQVLQQVDELGLQDRVIYISKIPNIDIHQYYKASNCFINFNEKEIFGMSILEAIYQGCPVVARRAPGPDMIIQKGITGYLCDSFEEMANSVKTLDIVISENEKAHIKERFSWDYVARDILNCLGLRAIMPE